MKILLVIFSLLLVLLLAGLWVGPGSYPDRWRIEKRLAVQEAANNEKKEQIDKMRAELTDIRSGQAEIEERARSEFGMIKDSETFYEVSLEPLKVPSKKSVHNKTTSSVSNKHSQ